MLLESLGPLLGHLPLLLCLNRFLHFPLAIPVVPLGLVVLEGVSVEGALHLQIQVILNPQHRLAVIHLASQFQGRAGLLIDFTGGGRVFFLGVLLL